MSGLIKCVSNYRNEGELTVGKEYLALSYDLDTQTVNLIDDTGDYNSYPLDRFERPHAVLQIGSAKQQFIERIEAELHGIVETMRRKNADYTGATDDPFANFKAVETAGVCSTEQGIVVRMHDKLSRVGSLLKTGKAQVQDESVQDTLKDLAAYSLILADYLSQKAKGV